MGETREGAGEGVVDALQTSLWELVAETYDSGYEIGLIEVRRLTEGHYLVRVTQHAGQSEESEFIMDRPPRDQTPPRSPSGGTVGEIGPDNG